MIKQTAVGWLILLLGLLFYSCNKPVLNKSNFKIIDTLYVARNGYNSILGYQVIVEINGSFYTAYLDNRGKMLNVNPREISPK